MTDVLERMIRYAKVATPADPAHEDQVPSNPEEHDLARMLADELQAMGITDAVADEHAYVIAHVPASEGCEDAPCLGFIAHIDASPDAPAHNVNPQVLHYEGGDLVIGEYQGEPVVLTEANTPGLGKLAGQDLLCSDGTTLLAVDDKAGVAEVMALVARLVADPSLKHPRLALCFAPDEEIGHGCALLDLDAFGAKYAYTMDGDTVGSVEYECFNAASASVDFHGTEIHPGAAKDIMVNALHLFEEFDGMLPAAQRPEHTTGYDGFFHLCTVEGNVMRANATYIIRDHSAERFAAKKQLMLDAADFINKRLGSERVTVNLRDQYRNMAEKLTDSMHLIDNAYDAFARVGATAYTLPIRGGTDGAQLSFRGLPCPNLSSGGYNYHSIREFVPVDSLQQITDALQELVAIYADYR